ncbi:MAG: acetyl-CoA carboxylase biotin carboxyl carrier protein subunit [Prevotellaceae bacterium]|jgi:biotin carboxyl carrier protein|nr:acetyl-CoA carboxylase biotin carboxyl carrier protein subunit [Prevotellaceae bacterium]
MENKDYKTLLIDDTAYKTLYTKKYENRAHWSPEDAREIKTGIPGTVIQLNVKVGDTVSLGDTLCLFEAMKMENIVRSPHAGTVCAVNIKEGDKLPKGFVMMMIDEEK